MVQPVIKTSLNNIIRELHEESSITFVCEVTGYPTPTIVWSRANRNLSDRVSISDTAFTEDDSVSVNLTITNATREDTGIYICSADNCIGNDSKSVKIAIQCKSI